MKNLSSDKKILVGVLGYGFGFLVGTIFASLVFRSFLSDRLAVILGSQQSLIRLTLDVAFIIAVLATAGAILGGIGSWVLLRFMNLVRLKNLNSEPEFHLR